MLLLGGGFALAKGSEVSDSESNINGETWPRADTQYGMNNNISRGGKCHGD